MQHAILTRARVKKAWTKVANVLILNGPAPVGFSYCDPAGPGADGYSCGKWDDTSTAKHNAIFLENWVREFPGGSNKIYLTGESYAGVYIPMLAREIIRNSSSIVAPRLAGFAVGDACVGSDVLCGGDADGPYWSMMFLFGHGQFSNKLYDEIMSVCPRDQLIGYGPKLTDKACIALLDRMATQVGGYFSYNLYDEVSFAAPRLCSRNMNSSYSL